MSIKSKMAEAYQSRTRDAIAFARSLGIDPDPWQEELLTSADRKVILNCCRQAGKSEMSAIIALHHAITQPHALVLILSPTYRQSGELFKKIVGHNKALSNPIASEINQATQLQLANRSRIVSLPGQNPDHVRGFSSPTLLIVDEAARVSQDLFSSVSPMLAVSGGRIILLSTPAGKEGVFYDTWEHGENWKRFKITADDVPRIPREWLEDERRQIGDRYFMQEFYCKFEDTDTQLFTTERIDRAFDHDYDPIDLDLGLDTFIPPPDPINQDQDEEEEPHEGEINLRFDLA
jgi:hypothetical protein